ncbi:MAG: alpha-1,2-fucosyltransferase [Planctomycetota bacterium]
MIVFCEHGQLGNQVFQYAALKTIAPSERIVLFGFDALGDTFDGIKAKRFFPGYGLRFRVAKRCLPVVERVIRATRLVTLIKERKETPRVDSRRGILNQVKYCSTSYFQSPEYFQPEALEGLAVQERHLAEARQSLEQHLANDDVPVFVHIRRGDYLKWPSRENPAVLPFRWYRDSMAEYAERWPQTRFLICTDDVPYAEDLFSSMPCVTICSKSLGHDFALMTLCQGGILSASSFAWWATFFAKRNNATQHFVAPNFWAGHRLAEWYPRHIKMSGVEYRPVEWGTV